MIRYKILPLLLIFFVHFLNAQSFSSKECIQGIWRGTAMDIEPHSDLSNLFQIIQGGEIYSFYIDGKEGFKSEFKFINFNIQEEDINFYSVKKENTLSSIQDDDSSYFYTEVDSDGNVAVDQFFICSEDHMTKLHFEYERLSFLPYSAYSQLKNLDRKEKEDHVKEFSVISRLKKAKVVTEKAFFHNQPNVNTRKKAFIVEDDIVYLDIINDDWVKVAYEGKKTTTVGWIKAEQLQYID